MTRTNLQFLALGFVMAAAHPFFSASSLADLSEVRDVGMGAPGALVGAFLLSLLTKPEK